MGLLKNIIMNLPEVAGPKEKRLSFKQKLKWTLLILVIFFALGMVGLFGLDPASAFQFEQFAVILGAQFGTLLTLGIGPIVTASIVLQLLNGSGIVKFDMTTPEGKRTFQGVQKLMSFLFIIFEALVFVFMGGLAPPAQYVGTIHYFQLQMLISFQLMLGGVLILYMDEVINKWGFGSGVSLFIAANVSQSLFIRLLSPLAATMGGPPVGAIPAILHFLPLGAITEVVQALAGIIATALVFVIAVYGQAMKVEIPLSFGRVRGHGIRWPLSFIYTSNIPVILVAALLANIQLFGRILENWGHPILGTFAGNSPSTGLVAWVTAPRLIPQLINQGSFFIGAGPYIHTLIYILIMIAGAVVFSIFWVQTSGMDARSQAKQMMASGLQIPGFRKDQRVLERLLNRYIWPLTVMGAITVGFLAALADVSGALTSGTGLLLAVMIIYKLYEDIAKQHMYDMHPMMRKFMEG
ncbi:preprotein translocase subunit SecY [Candidatus Woesearchaeota archaeon]|nr:preprotein translocase subunit SecY [Candidatus Woesearchaeota archaeon]MBW3021507.1 preprotein translocase subunit SecY [Candidatus Woesearchaeota archaeon]